MKVAGIAIINCKVPYTFSRALSLCLHSEMVASYSVTIWHCICCITMATVTCMHTQCSK